MLKYYEYKKLTYKMLTLYFSSIYSSNTGANFKCKSVFALNATMIFYAMAQNPVTSATRFLHFPQQKRYQHEQEVVFCGLFSQCQPMTDDIRLNGTKSQANRCTEIQCPKKAEYKVHIFSNCICLHSPFSYLQTATFGHHKWLT